MVVILELETDRSTSHLKRIQHLIANTIDLSKSISITLEMHVMGTSEDARCHTLGIQYLIRKTTDLLKSISVTFISWCGTDEEFPRNTFVVSVHPIISLLVSSLRSRLSVERLSKHDSHGRG